MDRETRETNAKGAKGVLRPSVSSRGPLAQMPFAGFAAFRVFVVQGVRGLATRMAKAQASLRLFEPA